MLLAPHNIIKQIYFRYIALMFFYLKDIFF